MEEGKVKQHVESIINSTFKILKDVYDNQQEVMKKVSGKDCGSRIVFPKKQDNTTRISEQELRFVFVEQLNKEISDWDVYYSVETPTEDSYSFKDEIKTGEGQSGNFDLVIYDSQLNRIALIEFKANNPTEHNCAKDFAKLNNEGSNLFRCFILIVKNANDKTFPNIHKKIEGNEGIFRAFSLETGEEITQSVEEAQIKEN
jgi:hypothetical protein